jgi:phosphohistidine phosphatase
MTTESSSQPRTLLLLRHGHGKPGVEGQADRDRHLDRRGRREAEAAGRAAGDWVPELALVSETVRTRETFDHFCKGLGESVDVRYLDALYEGPDISTLRRLVATEPAAELSTVLLVGHDFAISDLCKELLAAGTSAVDAGRLTADGMRTGMLAVFSWIGPWDLTAAADIRLVALSWAGENSS